MSDKPKATHQGVLTIGEKKLNCAVLDNGTRVISMGAIFKAFGRTKRGRMKTDQRVPNMPSFMDANNLQPFIGEGLKGVLKTLEYTTLTGRNADGYRAEILPLVCDMYLAAREGNALTKSQMPLAAVSEIIVRSLSKVGITALVDEATGYQEVRERDELQKILKAYISEELLPWTARFPMEFYKEMFRLRKWPYPPFGVKGAPKGPRYAGKLTRMLVYEKLPNGVLEELERRNPPNEKWQRKHKMFQDLTPDIGNPHLEKQVAVVTTLMKISPNWKVFERNFRRAFPQGPEQELMFEDDE